LLPVWMLVCLSVVPVIIHISWVCEELCRTENKQKHVDEDTGSVPQTSGILYTYRAVYNGRGCAVNGKEPLEHNILKRQKINLTTVGKYVPFITVKSPRVQGWCLTSDSRNAVPVARWAASSLFRGYTREDFTW